jgi:hypothetical protein
MKTIAEFSKNPLEKVVLSLTDFRGKTIFSIWVYFKDKDGNWRPSKKGISLNLGCWPDFEKAFHDLQKAIENL